MVEVDSWQWTLRVIIWELEVEWVRLEVDGWRSKAGGGRLEVNSWKWTLWLGIWELEVS